MFLPLAFADKTTRVSGGINQNQPIYLGEAIYEETVTVWHNSYSSYHVRYAYIGIDRDNIQIRYTYRMDDNLVRGKPETETGVLLLPLDSYGKTYLRLHELPKRPKTAIVPAKVLAITIDNKRRLTVVIDSLSKRTHNL